MWTAYKEKAERERKERTARIYEIQLQETKGVKQAFENGGNIPPYASIQDIILILWKDAQAKK